VNKDININYPLWRLLARTRQAIYRARQKELLPYGVSMRTSAVLFSIINSPEEITPKMISQQLTLEYHSVSEHLKRMEKGGLIHRIKDKEWKNLIRIEVTAKGYEAYSNSIFHESTDAIMSVLTYEEKIELWRILYRLRSKAMEYLGIEETDVYPPSSPEEL